MPGLSGVGISFGADRIYDVLNQLDLYPSDTTTATQVMFVNFGSQETAYCMPIVSMLRQNGIRTEMYPEAAKMKKQMGYANSKNIPFVALAGDAEMQTGTITLKDMASGTQQQLPKEQLAAAIEEIIKK